MIFALACDPPTPGVESLSYQRGISWYGNGASIIAMNVDWPVPTDDGFWVPMPGIGFVFVTAILTTRPFVTAAVPIFWIVGVPPEVVTAIATLTTVAIPTPPIEVTDPKPA